MLILVTLVGLVTLASASLEPSFTQVDESTISVAFPVGDPAVKKIVFTWTSDSVSRSSVIENALGHFTYTLIETGPFEYHIRYITETGRRLHEYSGTYQPQGAVVPKHHIVRRGTTVLHETFTSNHLDTSKWVQDVTCSGGGSAEFQMYTPEAENTYIKHGILYLRPTFTANKFGDNFLQSGTMDVRKTWGTCSTNSNSGCYRTGKDIPPIMSSKIQSKASISYGRVEVVAKLPQGDWIWPAIWLLPGGWPWKYGRWPASGEMDIMESRGNLDLKDDQGNHKGVNVINSHIHWGPSISQHKQAGTSRKTTSGLWSDAYHTYSIDWTADHIRIDVDGQPVFAWNTPSQGYFGYSHFSGHNPWEHGGHDAPFDGTMSVILNVAVGGNYFNDNWINKGFPKPWKAGSDSQMTDFWSKRHQWQSTWHGEEVAMKIKSVKMIQY